MILSHLSLYAISNQDSAYFKEKEELLSVKDELNEFYETKELEYQKNKASLEKIQQEILQAEKNIQEIKEENEKILKEIQRELVEKSIRMYDKMKPNIVVNIFTEMVQSGKIEQVFDIIVRMQEKNVIKIMKKLDTKTSALLMEKMQILKQENQ